MIENICPPTPDLASSTSSIRALYSVSMPSPIAAFSCGALLPLTCANPRATTRTRCGNEGRRFRVYCGAVSSASGTRKRLHKDLMKSLSGLNRGLVIDADSKTESNQESEVEDILEALETSLSESGDAFDWDLRYGDWDLAYTSSSLTRYAGGLTGMHKLLPGGLVGKISLNVSDEVSQWVFTEAISFELFGKGFNVDVVINGRVEPMGGRKEVWAPEKADMFGWKFYAETWKSLRAFTNTTVTYMDEFVKISRGTTGSAIVFVRSQAQDVEEEEVEE